MIADAYAPTNDVKTATLGRLLQTLAEDAMFALSAGGGADVLDLLGKRRSEAYAAVLTGQRRMTMSGEFDAWVVELSRAIAPICAPGWMPMADVIRERVTLEVGARGLRSLFSSTPSDKDVQRVKRLGTFTVRVLRAVFHADGALNADENRTLACVIASLGLFDDAARELFVEGPLPVEQLDMYGDIDPAITKAVLQGAWLAAAADVIDPREEHIIRVLAHKLSVAAMDLEVLRAEAVQRVEKSRLVGLATADAIRFVLSDRVPGHGMTLAAKAAHLLLTRRHRDEALAYVNAGAKVVLAKRFPHLGTDDGHTVLGITWAAALYEDPSLARRAFLRARHDRVAADLGEDGAEARHTVEAWLAEVLAPAAFAMSDE